MGQYRKSVLPGYNQALPKYQQRGQVDETADSLGEDILEILDPTGISSYDDVRRTFKNPDAGFWDKTFAVAGALPIVGKFGKLAKGVQAGTKAATKWGKAMQAGQKAVQTVGKSKPVKMVTTALTPVAAFDRNVSPVSRFVAGATQRAVQNIPGRAGKFVRGAADIGSYSNQNARFWKLGDALTGNRELVSQQIGGNIYDGMYNNSLNPTDMYFYAVGGVPNNPGFNALPDHVQRQIIANMMYGGSNLRTYQGDEDGSTVDDGMDYDAYQDETSYYPDDMFDFTEGQMIPGAAFSPAMQPIQTTPNYGMVGPQIPAGAQPSPARVAAAPSKGGGYSGVSIVDYLNQNPSAGGSDFASRKKLAAQLGIRGYTGTADQNMQMLGKLTGRPVAGSGRKSSGSKASGKKGPAPTQEEMDAYNEMEGRQNPYVAINPQTGAAYAVDNGTGTGMFPPGGGAEGTGVADDDGSGPSIWPYVGGAAGAGALGYGAYKMFRGRGAAGATPRGTMLPPPAGQKLLPSSEMANASRFRSNVNTGKDILSNIKSKGFYTVEDIKALKNSGYKNIEGMMREFPKGAATAKQTAATVSKAKQAADFAQKARRAIAPGQKVIGQASRMAPFMDAVKAGWAAAKATPALKLFRREDGGSTYSAGVFYGNGGNYPYGGNIYGQMPQMGQPLPQYMYGMQDGGSAQEMYVSPEEMEMLRQQGYDFDIIG